MPLRRVHRHVFTVGISMTPLIDVAFLLLTFFMLASHFASAEKVDIRLPRPDPCQAVDRKFRDRVLINLTFAGPGLEPGLTFGAVPLASTAELADRLEPIARENPQIPVILRADRRLSYGEVRGVMEIIAAHHLTRLQVVTELR